MAICKVKARARAARARAKKRAWVEEHPGVREVINALRRAKRDIKASGLTKKEYFKLMELEEENDLLRRLDSANG